MSKVIGCPECECDIARMNHSLDCSQHPDNLPAAEAAPELNDGAMPRKGEIAVGHTVRGESPSRTAALGITKEKLPPDPDADENIPESKLYWKSRALKAEENWRRIFTDFQCDSRDSRGGARMKCPSCGSDRSVAEVTYWGMFDIHLFHHFKGDSPEAVLVEWRAINSKPYPAIVGGDEVDDLRPLYLCPATLKDSEGREIKRVGPMVFKDEPEAVQEWLDALTEIREEERDERR